MRPLSKPLISDLHQGESEGLIGAASVDDWLV
jgi:hypothetical protein